MNKKLSEIKLKQSLDEAFIHLKRINHAGKNIKPFFPLTEDFMNNITDDETEHLDQFVFRFMKLQDCIGNRIFPVLLENLQEDYSGKPFLDILNRLEKLGIIESSYIWQVLRNIRNSLAHEYPENTRENIAALNELFIKMADLYSILRSVTEYISKKFEILLPAVPQWPPLK